MLKPTDPKIIRIDPAEDNARREAEEAAHALLSEFSRPQTPVPEAELARLCEVALGDTGQSRICRYLLFLLPGLPDPTGFKGEGLLELRALDRKLSEAFLTVLAWWRGPTKSDQPLYDVLRKMEERLKESSPETSPS